jgi:aspartate racemase
VERRRKEKAMLGVLGGMGPAATVDFMSKVIRLTPAETDQDHLPMVVMSDPSVPDRVAPILEGRGPSPAPAMIQGARALERAGAEALAIPCHTAHYWAAEVQAAIEIPILHIVDAVLAALAERPADGAPIGLLATAATLKADLYQSKLGEAGYSLLSPDQDLMARAVLPAIALVKRNRIDEAAERLEDAVARLQERGAETVILACTELPVALGAASAARDACLDATEALARACIAWRRAERR